MKRLKWIQRAGLAVLLPLILAACDNDNAGADRNPLAAGTLATIKIFGQTYQSEVVGVDGPVGTWETRWRDRVVAVSRFYRGLFPMSSREMDSEFVNNFEPAPLEELFPLEVGKEVSFSGTNHESDQPRDVTFWAHVFVRGTDEIHIHGQCFPVYIVDITIDYDRDEGPRRFERTVWYSEDLGMSLKSRSVFGDLTWAHHVLDLDLPGAKAARRRGTGRNPLGTTTI